MTSTPNTEFYGINTGGTPEEEALFSSPIKFGFNICWTARQRHHDKSRVYPGNRQTQRWCKSAKRPAPTGDNTDKYFMNTIYRTIPIGQQDGVFSAVAKQTMNDVLKNLNSQKLFALVKLIPNMVEGRHLYAYSFNDGEAEDFQGAGLAKDTPNS